MDFCFAVPAVVLGVGFIATPWITRLGRTPLASSAVVAGGIILTLLGLMLMRRVSTTSRRSPYED
jgi:hypothetical protein